MKKECTRRFRRLRDNTAYCANKQDTLCYREKSIVLSLLESLLMDRQWVLDATTGIKIL